MTVDQLQTGLLAMTNRIYGNRNYQIPQRIYALLWFVVGRTVIVVTGQPNLAPLDFANISLEDAVAGIRLLTQPTNGHKLLLPSAVGRLLISLLYRTARNEQGAIIYGTYTPATS
jgi:hypothetical protein